MRRVVDILVVLLIAVVGAAVWQYQKAEESTTATTADVQRSLTQLYERASYFGALENSTDTTNTLWPVAVLPSWFTGAPPTNGLLDGVDPKHVATTATSRPWIDVAPPGDKTAHPPDPVAVRLDQAQFWYNPNLGVFRARVAPTLNEVDALALYNELNGVELSGLLRDADPNRVPLAYTPGHTPSAASLASREYTPTQTTPQQTQLAASDFTFMPGAADPVAAGPARVTTPRQPSLFNPEPAATTYPGLEPEPEPAAAKPVGRTRLKDVTR